MGSLSVRVLTNASVDLDLNADWSTGLSSDRSLQNHAMCNQNFLNAHCDLHIDTLAAG